MNSKLVGLLAAVALLGPPAKAGNIGEPGSLLVFPLYDNSRGAATIYTVTNTSQDPSSPAMVGGKIRVHFFFIDATTCLHSDRSIDLSVNDTFTLVTREFDQNGHNSTSGYCYAYAEKIGPGTPVKFDWLTATLCVAKAYSPTAFTGTYDYEVQPFVFKAGTGINGAGLAEGANTDLETPIGDGIRDLDGREYEQAPDQIVIPKFTGQIDSFNSELVVVALDGITYKNYISLFVYDDNETAYSAEFNFTCWARRPLIDISGATDNTFLQGSDNNFEFSGFKSNGTMVETGWLRLYGNIAFSSVGGLPVINDPAFLAMLIEHKGNSSWGEMPFGIGHQANGDLLPLGGDVP